MMQRVRRLGIGQMARTMGALYFLLGILFAAIFALFGSMLGGTDMGGETALFGGTFLIVMPILYGVAGLVFGALIAALYNVVAGWTGGIELDLDGADYPADGSLREPA